MRKRVALVLLLLLIPAAVVLSPSADDLDPRAPTHTGERNPPESRDLPEQDGEEPESGPASAPDGATPFPDSRLLTAPEKFRIHLCLAVDRLGRTIRQSYALAYHDGWDTTPVRVESDREGLLRVPESTVRRTDILVAAEGYAPADPGGCADEGRACRVVLSPAYRLGGVVVTEDGEPVARAKVSLDFGLGAAPPAQMTDAEGRFSIDGLEALIYSVEVVSPEGRGDFQVAAGDVTARLVLVRQRTLRGQVVHADGSPAPGARVRGVVTDSEGRFEVTVLRPGPQEVHASMGTPGVDQWQGKTRVEIPERGEPPEIRIELAKCPSSYLSVLVLTAKGAKVAGATVWSSGVAGKTDETGRALLSLPVRPGTKVRTVATPPGLRKDRAPWANAEGETTALKDGPGIEIRIPEPRLLTVIVRGPDGGTLPGGIYITVELEGIQNWRARMSQGPHGPDRRSFWVHPNEPSSRRWQRLLVWAEGHPRISRPLVLPEQGTPIEVRLQVGTSVTGRLFDASGRPARGGSVYVSTSGRPGDGISYPSPDGSFRIDGLHAGRAQVLLLTETYLAVRRFEVELSAGETLDLGDLVRPDALVLRGRVSDVEGRPLGGVRISGMDGFSRQGYGLEETHTHSNGTFDVLVPPHSELKLLAEKSGFGSQFATVPEGGRGDEERLVMLPAGRLLIHLEKRADWKASALSCHVRFPGEEWSWQPRTERAGKDQWLLTDLPPGELVALVQSRGGTNEKTVRIASGRTTEVELEVR